MQGHRLDHAVDLASMYIYIHMQQEISGYSYNKCDIFWYNNVMQEHPNLSRQNYNLARMHRPTRVLSRTQNLGGEAIIDNVAVRVDVGVACTPYCAKCKNWHFMIWLSLERVNFNPCMISAGILKATFVLSLAILLGREAGLLGEGSFPPASPSR